MNKEPIEDKVNEILAAPCPYKVPPLQYLNGHAVCPCICNAIRLAYIDGWKDGAQKEEPQIGRPND